jgi:hypothetical protein
VIFHGDLAGVTWGKLSTNPTARFLNVAFDESKSFAVICALA